MSYFASQPVKESSLQARIVRADGTVEDLGTIAYWHRSLLKRILWRVSQLMRGRKPGRIIR